MTTAIELVQDHLLKPSELELAQIERVLGGLNISGVDLADLYFESSHAESWSLEDGPGRLT